MQIPIYPVDAFTDKLFAGNPAAVCPLQQWLPDQATGHCRREQSLRNGVLHSGWQ